ncbi:MAG: hypothetical protein DHS20C10_01740 [marine bacterium B5-7]|nr:MAG: hypothetical protein DHS20C10_01740 [marine bacterium B5-7]
MMSPNMNHSDFLVPDLLAEDTGFSFIKSRRNDLQFEALSPLAAQEFGYKRWQDAIGHTDHDIPSDVCKDAETYRIHDHKILFLDLTSFAFSSEIFSNNEHHFTLAEKTPCKYKGFGLNIDSLFCRLNILEPTRVADLITCAEKNMPHAKDNYYYTIENASLGNLPLGNKESECLFYWIRGFSFRAISQLIGFDVRTVLDILDNICFKSRYAQRHDLRDYMIDLNYQQFIPPTIWKKFMGNSLLFPQDRWKHNKNIK